MPSLVEAASFENMKANAGQYVPGAAHFKSESEFFSKGTSGQWRDVMDDATVQSYFDKLNEPLPPDAAAWLNAD